MSMKLLIIDTETTGLCPADSTVIELGAVLFDVELRSVICQISFLLPTLTNEAEFVNRIQPELTMRVPDLTSPMAASFWAMVAEADYAVAHNSAFDRQWFGGQSSLPSMPLQWVCSMEDIQWPLNTKRGRASVMSLCVDYGVPVWQAHRALTDCIYLAEVMKREPQLEQLIENALLPRHVYVSNLGYEQRQHCKDAGFTWNNLVPKMWAKKLTEREAAALAFSVSIAD